MDKLIRYNLEWINILFVNSTRLNGIAMKVVWRGILTNRCRKPEWRSPVWVTEVSKETNADMGDVKQDAWTCFIYPLFISVWFLLHLCNKSPKEWQSQIFDTAIVDNFVDRKYWNMDAIGGSLGYAAADCNWELICGNWKTLDKLLGYHITELDYFHTDGSKIYGRTGLCFYISDLL